MPLTPGFAEALRGEIDPDEAIKPTSVAHLSLLPAGQCDLTAIQALAQDEVQTLFYHLKEEYEFVILDVSPVLPVADALVIGQHADAVLFSVLRDVSKLPQVYEAQQRLAALGIRMLGAVVSGERGRTYGGRRRCRVADPQSRRITSARSHGIEPAVIVHSRGFSSMIRTTAILSAAAVSCC